MSSGGRVQRGGHRKKGAETQRDKDTMARMGALVKKDVYVEGLVMGSGGKARCEFGPPFLPW